ncbi:DinB family protein [Sphingobacterium griseoflavum]|uniref:DinB-like domain-containing protein n=1 Tax=Sphingobacterium griseoflavum TaxID=1474952 RepID=A0ABQ3HTH3_9SPHI|nr:DinB family protein [Sphingobacterium griseoflavum]GHE23534.1 hypothetical protein GCM10017764_05020 [Sphingobacterium griseoflavum]
MKKNVISWLLSCSMLPLLVIALSFSAVEKTNEIYAIEKETPPAIDSLLQYFEETTTDLTTQIRGLSAQQLAFKPTPEKWSISQCLEHIILSETMLFKMAKDELQKAPQPQRRKEVKVSDEALIQMMGDRTQKFQAPQELQPVGKYTDSETALAELAAARAPILAYIRQADEQDLRNHISEYPTGTVNGYQNLLFIAAHMARHIKQIEEIKMNKDFPKK